MDKDEKIIELTENYVDEIRKYCNGLESTIKIITSINLGELNFNEIHYEITQELNKYFRKSRNDKKNIILSKLRDILKDLIYEFENKTLIQENFFKDNIANNNNFIEEKYNMCEHIYNAIHDLHEQLEIEIEKRENRKDFSGRIDSRIDSSHCIDTNISFTIALLEEILRNPKEIKELTNIKKSIILERLTGHKRKTFTNNYSTYNGVSNQKNIDEAKKLIDSLLE